jgi:hypothetical protein
MVHETLKNKKGEWITIIVSGCEYTQVHSNGYTTSGMDSGNNNGQDLLDDMIDMAIDNELHSQRVTKIHFLF